MRGHPRIREPLTCVRSSPLATLANAIRTTAAAAAVTRHLPHAARQSQNRENERIPKPPVRAQAPDELHPEDRDPREDEARRRSDPEDPAADRADAARPVPPAQRLFFHSMHVALMFRYVFH